MGDVAVIISIEHEGTVSCAEYVFFNNFDIIGNDDLEVEPDTV